MDRANPDVEECAPHVRVRVPRGKLRNVQHPQWSPSRREGFRRSGKEGVAIVGWFSGRTKGWPRWPALFLWTDKLRREVDMKRMFVAAILGVFALCAGPPAQSAHIASPPGAA